MYGYDDEISIESQIAQEERARRFPREKPQKKAQPKDFDLSAYIRDCFAERGAK